MSPVSSIRTPATSTSSTTLASLAVLPSPGPTVGESGSGQSTCEGDVADRRVTAYGAAWGASPAARVASRTRATPAGRVGQPAGLDLRHVSAAEHAREPVDVVGVEVGEHQRAARG